MKALKTLFSLSLVTIFLSSYCVPHKNGELAAHITFVNEAGEEISKLLTETNSTDWKNEVKSAEFRMGEVTVEVEGIVVYMPKNGDAVVLSFKEKTTFTGNLQKICTNNTLIPGDRFILDNLKIVGQKKNYYPIVRTLN